MDLERMDFEALLDSVAAKTPTPGGGAVASAVGALAAALAGMVISYSVGKKALAAHEGALRDAAARLVGARRLLLALASEDAEAYGLVNELGRLAPDDERRVREMAGAMAAAVQTPLATIAACADLLRLFESLAPITNRNLRSDLAIAAVLAEATARASKWNVEMNLGAAPEDAGSEGVAEAGGVRTALPTPEQIRGEMERMLEDARKRLERVEAMCR